MNKYDNIKPIKINNYPILIDCFLSNKYNSLVVILNTRKQIENNTGVNVDNIKYYLNDNIVFFEKPMIKDYTNVNGYNPCLIKNDNRFHIEVLYLPNVYEPDNIEKKYQFKISINSNDYCYILDPPNSDFINLKCMTTIMKNEYHLINTWVDYHKKLGFQKFFIYDNNSTIISDKFVPNEDIIIIKADWQYFQKFCYLWLYSAGELAYGQIIQQNHTLWKYSPKFLALTDLDEYINPHNFNIFDENKPVLSIPNYFFNSVNSNFADLKNSKYREYKDFNKDKGEHRRKCIIQSKDVDLFMIHWPINFKDQIHATYDEVQLNHYINLSSKKRHKEHYTVIDETILKNL